MGLSSLINLRKYVEGGGLGLAFFIKIVRFFFGLIFELEVRGVWGCFDL